MSFDGLELYFSSNREPTYGYNDIWKTQRATLKSPWQKPLNLGPKLNSQHGELSLSQAGDGSFVILGSKIPENGGTGLYMSIVDQKTKSFGKPEYLPDQINASGHEGFAHLSVDGKTMWFTSSRHTGYGGSDIYVSYRVRKETPSSDTTPAR